MTTTQNQAIASARVLQRLLALAKSEGIPVFSQDPGPGFPRCAIVPDDEPPHEQARALAEHLALCLVRGEETWRTSDQEVIDDDDGDARAEAFACKLLANLYAAQDHPAEPLAATPQDAERLAVALAGEFRDGWGGPRTWGSAELEALHRARLALQEAEDGLRRALGERQAAERFLDSIPSGSERQ